MRLGSLTSAAPNRSEVAGGIQKFYGRAVRIVAPLLVVLTLAVLWMAGEQHRGNCIRQQRDHCSVLPWDNGSGSTTFDFRTVDTRGPRVQFGPTP